MKTGAQAIGRLETALGEAAGAEVVLERPATRRTATTRRTSRCGSRAERGSAAAGDRGGARRARGELPDVERAEIAGPGFVNLWLAPRVVRRGARRDPRGGRAFGGGSAGSGARAGRDGLGEPDGPDHGRARRGTAPTATRSRACSSSPATRSSASTTTTTPARRWSASAPPSRRVRRGEEPPEDGYQGDYVAELASSPATRCRAMLHQIEASLERFRIHFDSWALQSELEKRLPRVPAAPRHLREGRRRLGAFVGATATTRTGS